MDNRDGTDQYGYDGFIVQDVGKERREAGIKGPIIGNWKHIGQQSRQNAPQSAHNEAKANGYQPQRSGAQGGAQPPTRDNGAVDGPDDADDIPFSPAR
jgi:hypothetical protein